MAEPTTPTQPETPPEAPAKEQDIDKIIEKTAQSAADRVRTEYSKKLKELAEENENLKKEKMSAKEKADYEALKLKEELEAKVKDLNRRELELLATKTLEKEGLSGEFMDYVIGTDKDATLLKISKLKATFDKALGAAVDDKMKASARDPNKGRDGSGKSSEIETMTPAEIKAKGMKDPEWFKKNQAEIMAKAASFKKT